MGTSKKAEPVAAPEVTGQELGEVIYVVHKYGAFNTNKVRGHTASCTSNAKEAAERLAGKLFGTALRSVTEVDPGNKFARMFLAKADPIIYAWCWATGLIEFGDKVPDDAIKLGRGPDRALRERLQVLARHGMGRSAGQLLVPGVPEAVGQKEGLREVQSFLVWAATTTNFRRDNCSVMFWPYQADQCLQLRERVNERRARLGQELIFSPCEKDALERDHMRSLKAMRRLHDAA